MSDLELALKKLDEARAELEQVKKSNMHLVIENAQLKPKAEKYEEAMKLGDDETTIEALKIGYETMRNKYNEMIAERDEALKRINELELSCLYKDEEIRQLQANFDACKHLADKNIELHNRISELEQKNKVLVDGAKIVKKNVFIFGNDEDGYELCPKHEYDQCITNQEYKKYNAMLELVEVEE